MGTGEIWDLVVTLDDATSEHTSMFFCAQEGTDSSFHGIGQTMTRYGMFCSLYTDREAITSTPLKPEAKSISPSRPKWAGRSSNWG